MIAELIGDRAQVPWHLSSEAKGLQRLDRSFRLYTLVSTNSDAWKNATADRKVTNGFIRDESSSFTARWPCAWLCRVQRVLSFSMDSERKSSWQGNLNRSKQVVPDGLCKRLLPYPDVSLYNAVRPAALQISHPNSRRVAHMTQVGHKSHAGAN